MITGQDIRHAYDTIKPYLRRTPVVQVDLGGLTGSRSAPSGSEVVLKLEQLQCAGSFKTRGAFANLLLRTVPSAGVVAASGGNHGVAAAHAWATGSGALSVHAFDQRETLLGQGSLALELAEQVHDLDTVLVPVGGGGLIAGIAAWFAGTVRVIGVEPEGAPTLTRARACGRPTDAPTGSIAADALAPRRVGDLVFPITACYVSDIVLVDDVAIRRGQHALWHTLRIIAEPAAAVGVAALLTGAYQPGPGERVAVVISGANTTPADPRALTPIAQEEG